MDLRTPRGRRLLHASLAGTVVATGALASVAGAGGSRPQLAEPLTIDQAKAQHEPTAYSRATPPTFTVKSKGGTGKVFLVVSGSRATGGDYGLKHPVFVAEMTARSDHKPGAQYAFDPATAKNADASWLAKAGTYWWTAVRIDCSGKTRASCLVAADPRAIQITK